MSELLAGLDGCKRGWVAAIAPKDDLSVVQIVVSTSVASLLEGYPIKILAIDIPIGLPSMCMAGGRPAEQSARSILTKRRSSIFSTPARAAVEATDYAEACRLALENSEPRRSISQQSFAIFPKIRELDSLLRSSPPLRDRIFEVHPEVSFAMLNDGREMTDSKKTASGEAERKSVLKRHGIPEFAMEARRTGVSNDDLLDALVALLTARRIAEGTAKSFPDMGDADDYGIPCVIHA